MYQLEIKRSVVKEIRRLPSRVQQQVQAAIRHLVVDPRPDGCKKLKGADQYAIRVSEYRVLYEIDDDRLIVLVLRVRHRRDVYRNL